jgi:alpha-N-arabinofuranosidase
MLLLATLLFPALSSAQARAVHARIDASKTGSPISKYLYGQFLEHIGGIVNNGVWAEMLDDRKFYYPIMAHPPAEPPAGPTGMRRAPLRRWMPVGPEETVTMDTTAPYVGDHTPLVTLGPEVRGIRQAGLAVRRGRSYAGRAVLAGTPGVSVRVALVWGSAPTDRQTVVIGKLGPDFRKYPLRFEAAGDSDDARVEIVGTGTGAFRVGAVSLMPGNNVQGFRAEVVSALRQLHSGVYRFPGGNFVSGHEWRDAIGDPDKRPPIMDPVWHAVQPNDVGTDEFMTLCRLLDVEPYVTVNAGFGDAWSAAQLVEYANGVATTPMGRLRAANGHPEPYKVRFWGVGNEPWGEWQLGFMPLEQFVLKHNLFAKAMRRIDPTIRLIAAGAWPAAMTGSKQAKRLNGQIVPDYLSPADWSGGLLSHCLENMDLLSEHFYSTSNQRFDVEKGDRVATEYSLVEWMRQPATQVRAKYEHYQEYLKRIPGLREKRVPISLDEWAYIGVPRDSYKVVPAYAWVFHEMFRHTDAYQLGGFTFATSMISADRTDAVLNPTGLLFKMYREHFGTLPVEVSGDSPQPKPVYPAGGDQPRVNPGSDTYPLDVAAALSEDRRTLTVAVLNPSDSEQRLELSIAGALIAGGGRRWRMAPRTVDATITVGQEPGVEVQEEALSSVPDAVDAPPFSVSIYSFALVSSGANSGAGKRAKR